MPQPRPRAQDTPEQSPSSTGSASAPAEGTSSAATTTVGAAAAVTSAANGAAAALASQAVLETGRVLGILGGMRRFFTRKNKDEIPYIASVLTARYPGIPRAQVDAIVREEMDREVIFQRRALARAERDLTKAAGIEDERQRNAKIKMILERERRYVEQHQKALTDRVLAHKERMQLREISPRGAWWLMSPHVKEHTLDAVGPDVLVAGPQVLGAARRPYAGKLIEIVVSSGEVLTVSPKHPVLTERGWVNGEDINAGDNLFRDSGGVQRHDLRAPEDVDDVNTAEQVFKALDETASRLSTRHRVEPLDFHGDVAGGEEVHVVGAYGSLEYGRKLAHRLRQRALLRSDPSLATGAPNGHSLTPLRRQSNAPSRGARATARFREPVEFIRGELRVGKAHGLATATADRDPGVEKATLERLARAASLAGELLDGLSGEVTLDEVIEIRDVSFRGHVYDIETDGGWYTANGLIVSNCMAMGASFWPWAVLDIIHPPLHSGCPCVLLGEDEAKIEGLLPPDFDPEPEGSAMFRAKQAIESARKQMLQEAEYSEVLHPRGRGGKWIARMWHGTNERGAKGIAKEGLKGSHGDTAVWATSSRKDAADYSTGRAGAKTPIVMPVDVTLDRPFVVDYRTAPLNAGTSQAWKDAVAGAGINPDANFPDPDAFWTDRLREQGYDGVVSIYPPRPTHPDGDMTVVEAFDPAKVKLVTPQTVSRTTTGRDLLELDATEPGTKPIPEGAIRLWHYTYTENLPSIAKQGLLYDKGRGDDGKGSEGDPSRGVWASTKAPGDGDWTTHNYIEFWVMPQDISQSAEHYWDQDPVEWAKGYHHVILKGDAKPEQIVAIHTPQSSAFRYLMEEYPTGDDKGMGLTEYVTDPTRYDETLTPAIAAWMKATGQTGTLTEARGGYDPVLHPRDRIGKWIRTVRVPRSTSGPRANVIAIDGPSASGKSTIAKKLATDIGARYVDTGAMFRVAGLASLQGQDPVTALRDANVQGSHVYLHGQDVTEQIRAHDVDMAAAKVGQDMRVRAAVKLRIEKIVDQPGVSVVEGRDSADALKAGKRIYLTASLSDRAARRAADRGQEVGTVQDAIARRDAVDSANLANAKANANIVVDTTGLNLEQGIEATVDALAASLPGEPRSNSNAGELAKAPPNPSPVGAPVTVSRTTTASPPTGDTRPVFVEVPGATGHDEPPELSGNPQGAYYRPPGWDDLYSNGQPMPKDGENIDYDAPKDPRWVAADKALHAKIDAGETLTPEDFLYRASGRGDCFGASKRLADDFPGVFTAVAGRYQNDVVKVEPPTRNHAWVTMKDGTILDVTHAQFNGDYPVVIVKPGDPLWANYTPVPGWSRREQVELGSRQRVARTTTGEKGDTWTPPQGTILYHVAPTRIRGEIEEIGLDPNAKPLNPSDARTAEGTDSGVFMWETFDTAWKYRGQGPNMYRDMDVWQVDVGGTLLHRDTWFDSHHQDRAADFPGAWFDKNAIPPDRVTMRSANPWVPYEKVVKFAQVVWPQKQQVARTTTGAPSLMYHLTDNPNFALDPTIAPYVNTTSGFGGDRKGLYVSPDPEQWFNGYDYVRPFVAEVEVPPLDEYGGYSGENFLPAEQFDKAKVKRVIPWDEYVREHYGEYGHFEENAGETPKQAFDQPRARPPEGYRYEGPDARDMTPEQAKHYKDLADQYIREQRPMIAARGWLDDHPDWDGRSEVDRTTGDAVPQALLRTTTGPPKMEAGIPGEHLDVAPVGAQGILPIPGRLELPMTEEQALKDSPAGRQFPADLYAAKVGNRKLYVGVDEDGDQYVIEDPYDPEFDASFSSDAKPVEQWLYDLSDYELESMYPTPDPWEDIPDTGWQMFHGTDRENLDSILADGMVAQQKTGIPGEPMWPGVWVTDNYQTAVDYATGMREVGPVVAIDLGAMKRDGYMPALEREPGIRSGEQRESAAAALGVEDFYDESASNNGVEPDTLIIRDSVPAKYVSVMGMGADDHQEIALTTTRPGTRAEAEQWMKGAKWSGFMFHGTTVEGEASIMQNGVNTPIFFTTGRESEAGPWAGVHLSSDPPRVVPVAVRFDNPLILTNEEGKYPEGLSWGHFEAGVGPGSPYDRARDAGYDGVVAPYGTLREDDTWAIALRPDTVRVVSGSSGAQEVALTTTMGRPKGTTAGMIRASAARKANVVPFAVRVSDSPPPGQQIARTTMGAPAAVDLPPKPEFPSIPGMGIDELRAQPGWEETSARYYEKERQWKHTMLRALATGKITQQEAEKRGYFVQRGKYEPLPDHLYHVTTARDGVLAIGLKTREELGQNNGAGLGGGTDDTISFTEDPKTAQEIKAAVLEAGRVARGDYSVAQMIEDARTGKGTDRPYLQDVIRSWGGAPKWVEGDPFPPGLQAILDGTRPERVQVTPLEMSEILGVPWPDAHDYEPNPAELAATGWQIDRPGHDLPNGGRVSAEITRPRDYRDDADDWMRFYKAIAAFRQNAGGPMDPLFFSQDSGALARMDPGQVAVVEVEPVDPSYRGYQVSALGEWRTNFGDLTRIIGVDGRPYVEESASVPEAPQIEEAKIDPLHPRDRRGRWIEKLGKLKQGDRPLTGDYSGIAVTRGDDGFIVHNGGSMMGFPMPVQTSDPVEVADLLAYPPVPEGQEGTLADPAVLQEMVGAFKWEDAGAAITSIRYRGSTVTVNGLLTRKGQGVLGGWQIRFTPVGEHWKAYHDEIVAPTGGGAGSHFMRHMEEEYARRDITEIHLTAAMSRGGYVWAREGFRFDTGRSDNEGASERGQALSLLQSRAWEWAPKYDDPEYPDEHVSLEQAAEFMSHFAGTTEFDGESLESMLYGEGDEWDREVVAGLGGPYFQTPQEIAMYGIENAWEETDPRTGQTYRNWIGKDFLMGAKWEGVKRIDPAVMEEAAAGTSDLPELVARMNLAYPPWQVDDYTFWMKVREHLMSLSEGWREFLHPRGRGGLFVRTADLPKTPWDPNLDGGWLKGLSGFSHRGITATVERSEVKGAYGRVTLALSKDGERVGLAQFRVLPPDRESIRRAKIDNLYLRPDARGEGATDALLGEFYAHCRENDVDLVQLEAIDVGGYFWASEGYTWVKPAGIEQQRILWAAKSDGRWDNIVAHDPEGAAELEALINAESFESEAHMAMFGRKHTWEEDGHTWWIGKALLAGARWDGERAP